MTDNHYVIIGNGITANCAAETIRKGDAKSRLTLISDEFFPFYHRHLLIDYLVGKKSEEELIVRPPSYYKENNIRLRLGQKVIKTDLAAKVLYLQHMEKIHYTRLLLAIGGKPRVPEIYFSFQEHFTTLKTLADARRLKARLPRIKSVLIVGGDLISVKVARALRSRDIAVTFLVDQSSFWPLDLTEERQQNFIDSLTAQGVDVIANDQVSAVSPAAKNAYEVRTAQGRTLQVDMVGAFFGLVPDISFLLGSGLDLERGIIVDEHLKTNIDDVYAAGDCAQVYNPQIRNYWISIGCPNAERLGKIAGHNMLGAAHSIDQPLKSILHIEGITVATSWWKEF